MTNYITQEQLENLGKLADYLERLPEDYEGFDMKYYLAIGGGQEVNIEDLNSGEFQYRLTVDDNNMFTECGTVACAVGHGPSAGIHLSHDDTSWPDYAERVFGAAMNGESFRNEVWDYLFDANWGYGPEATAADAAKRIRIFLSEGIPADFTGAKVQEHY